MRIFTIFVSQIAALCVIGYLGRFPAVLLASWDLLGRSGFDWFEQFGGWTYLAASGGLLTVAVATMVFGGQVRENQIVISESMLGARLFKIWLRQNLVIAFLSVSAFLLFLLKADPQLRGVILRSVFHLS